MKGKKFLSVLIGLILISSIMLAQEKPINVESEEIIAEPAWISYLEGAVKLNFEKAEINMIVLAADELKTKEGRVEVCLNGNYFRLDEYTEVIFAALQEDFMSLRIKFGNVYVRVKDEVEVQTPNKEATLPAGLYLIEVSGDKTDIYTNPKIIENDFDRWNSRREREINRLIRMGYLPEELAEYGYLLDDYGTWRYYAPYGNIWIPKVGYGWSPYFYGRWNWYPFYGWTWLSYDGPWGWLVFHYGRWQWHSIWGWYWTPTRFWGPAWVYWYWDSYYYGWCPMWYGGYDSYYYRHYGSYYRNTRSKVWTFIRKDQLKSRNISKSIISEREIKKIPQSINIQKLRKKIETTTTGAKGKRLKLLKIRQIQPTVKARTTTKAGKVLTTVPKQRQIRTTKEQLVKKQAVTKKTSKAKSRTTKKATTKTTTKKKKKKKDDNSYYYQSLSQNPHRNIKTYQSQYYSSCQASTSTSNIRNFRKYPSRYTLKYAPNKSYSVLKYSSKNPHRYLSRPTKYAKYSSKYSPSRSVKSKYSRSVSKPSTKYSRSVSRPSIKYSRSISKSSTPSRSSRSSFGSGKVRKK